MNNDDLEAQAERLMALVTALDERMQASNEAVLLSDERINESNQAIRELVKITTANRRLIRGVIVSVVLDVLLSVGLSISLVLANNASHQAHALAVKNRAAGIVACEAGNAFRTSELALWNHILDLSPPTQVTKDFKVYVTKAFALRDCQAASR